MVMHSHHTHHSVGCMSHDTAMRVRDSLAAVQTLYGSQLPVPFEFSQSNFSRVIATCGYNIGSGIDVATVWRWYWFSILFPAISYGICTCPVCLCCVYLRRTPAESDCVAGVGYSLMGGKSSEVSHTWTGHSGIM